MQWHSPMLLCSRCCKSCRYQQQRLMSALIDCLRPRCQGLLMTPQQGLHRHPSGAFVLSMTAGTDCIPPAQVHCLRQAFLYILSLDCLSCSKTHGAATLQAHDVSGRSGQMRAMRPQSQTTMQTWLQPCCKAARKAAFGSPLPSST